MRTYAVVVTATAKHNLREGYAWAARYAPDTAAQWLDRFYEALQSLSRNPQRCSIAPESEVVNREIRQFLFGRRRSTWRALFVIEQDQVRILHVRRGTRDTASSQELDP
jgi:plasmid stabilization system protein ParE